MKPVTFATKADKWAWIQTNMPDLAAFITEWTKHTGTKIGEPEIYVDAIKAQSKG